MALSAPGFAVDTVRALMASTYPGVLAEVCAERGVDAGGMAIAETRATIRFEDMDGYTFPIAWVEALPDGRVDETTTGSVRAFTTLAVFVSDRHTDGEALAERLMCHLIALTRTFLLVASLTGMWEIRVTDWMGTPPYAPDELWVGSVGVQIQVQTIEALD